MFFADDKVHLLKWRITYSGETLVMARKVQHSVRSDVVRSAGLNPVKRDLPRGTRSSAAENSSSSQSVPIDAPHIDREAIARLAYSYWVARGCCGGSAEEDWLRAERELSESADVLV